MLVNTPRVALTGLLSAALLANGLAGAPVPAERVKAQKELAALGTKLHGNWIAGPCEGLLTFQTDGTYSWVHRGPGGEAESGAWALQGTPTVPVLVLKCKTADDRDREGKTAELPLVMQEDGGFTMNHPEASKPMEFVRVKCGTRPPFEKLKAMEDNR